MKRTLTRFALLVITLLLIGGIAASVPADQYVNSSEPAFLHDIGPQDERTDNPMAAAITALAVAAIILRGLHKYGRPANTA